MCQKVGDTLKKTAFHFFLNSRQIRKPTNKNRRFTTLLLWIVNGNLHLTKKIIKEFVLTQMIGTCASVLAFCFQIGTCKWMTIIQYQYGKENYYVQRKIQAIYDKYINKCLGYVVIMFLYITGIKQSSMFYKIWTWTCTILGAT